MSLRVFLLGRFEVEQAGVPVPKDAWRRRRPADLLKRIALAPGHSLARDQLIEELWPDKDPTTGANNLHRALHDLRQVLGGKYVAPDKGVIRLADAWVDVAAFEDQAARSDPAALAAAVSHYRGDLCPDDPYGDLLDGFRRALRQRFLDVAYRLVRHELAAGNDAGVIDVLRRIVAVDATQEDAHRDLMQALARTGRHAEALQHFDACVAALRELGIAPSAQTIATHQAITRSARAAANATPETAWMRLSRRLLGTSELSALRGRDDQLRGLRELEGAGSTWLVGESGVGKTRLAFEVARLAVERGVNVLSGVCLGDEAGAAPYAPFFEMFAEQLRARGEPATKNPFAAVTSGEAADAQVDQLRLFDSVQRTFELLANPAPPLIVLDDLQYADRATLDLCHHLVRATRSRSMRLLFTCRSDGLVAGAPVHALFTGLLRQRLARRLVVERLGEDDTRALMQDVLQRSPGEALARSVYELTGGNAFYIEEVARAVGDGGDASDLVSEDLAETVRERVARLGPAAESLLVAASAMGQRFAFDVAAAVAEVAVPAALEALDDALRARLIDEVEGAYVFRHRLVRESLYRALTRARRVHLHARTAQVLETRGAAHREQLAWHWREAGEPARAFRHIVAAGDHAVAHAGVRQAVGLYLEALACLQPSAAAPDAERFALLVKLGRSLVTLGELEPALARFDEALALGIDGGYRPGGAERAQARCGAALALMIGGRLAAAGDRLDAALHDLGGTESDRPELSAFYYYLALLRSTQGRFADALTYAERCLEAAERHGDERAQARAREALVIACHALGDQRSAIQHEAKRQAIAGSALDAGELFDVHFCFFDLHLTDGVGRLGARPLLESTEAAARALGAQRSIALCCSVRGTSELFSGDLAQAEARLREAYALYRAVGLPSGQATCLQRLAQVLLATDRLDEARSAISDGIFLAQTSPLRAHVAVRLYASLAKLEREAGDLDAAREAMRSGEQEAEVHGRCVSCALDLERERVCLELQTNRLDAAEGTAARLEAIAGGLGHAGYRAEAHLARARLGVRKGDGDVQRNYRAASAAYREAGQSLEARRVDLEALGTG